MYKNNYQNNHECCFPIDICFTVKEGKCNYDENRKQKEYEYGYDYENRRQEDYGYENRRQENFGYDYEKRNHQDYDYNQNNCDYDDKNEHECCFPIDICLKIKEGKKDDRRDEKKHDDCRCKKDRDDNKCYNRNNCFNLGLLGCLCNRFRKF